MEFSFRHHWVWRSANFAAIRANATKIFFSVLVLQLFSLSFLTGQDINTTTWNGWIDRGSSISTGVYAKGGTGQNYQIYTAVFAYNPSNPVPGTSSGFVSGRKIFAVGIRNNSGATGSPTIKLDNNNNSFAPENLPTLGKSSFSADADLGDAVLNSSSGNPTEITIRSANNVGNFSHTNSGNWGNLGQPGFRGINPGTGVWKIFFDLDQMTSEFATGGSRNPSGPYLNPFGNTITFAVGGLGGTEAVLGVSLLNIASATPSNTPCGGNIAVNWSGGTAPFTVAWSGTASGSTTGLGASPYTITGLSAGTYAVTVTDANGATSTQSGLTIQNLPVRNVTANTYHSTIGAAIAAATAGDVIEVCAGTYTIPTSSTILVDKSLTLKGANYGVCGTSTRGAESKIVLNHSSGFAMTVRTGGVTVDGFEFEIQLGRDAINVNTPYVASALSTMSNFNFSNNIFRSSTTATSQKNGIVFGENNLNGNQATPNDQALNANATIQCNKFDFTTFATSSRGIVMTTQFDMHTYDNFTISDNLFQMSSANGTGIAGTAVPNRHTSTNFAISNNTFSAGSTGLDLTKLVTPTIENNSFSNFTFKAMGVGSTNGGAIRGNTINGASAALLSSGQYFGYGIDLYGGTDFATPANGPTGSNDGLAVENNVVSNFTHPTETNQNFRAINIRNNPGSGLFIKNNAISNVQNGILIASTATTAFNINENSFTTATTAIRNNSTNITAPATCNWYGTVNAATIATLISGNVTYSPFLVNGTDNAPGTTGFQPVPNACSGCSNQPRLQTSINGIVVTSNNDGTTDAGTFTVCNGTPNNVVLGNFTELNGVTPATNLRVYQTVALTNATFGYCNNCQALLSAFTPGSPATLALVNPTIPGSAVVTFRLWNDDSPANNVLDNGECASDVIQYTITVNPLPQLQTTINTVQVANNNNGTDDTGTLTVCNANTNNLFFTQFADLTGATPAANVKVIQQFTRTNVTFAPADGVAPLSSYTPAFNQNVALVNTAMSGTLVMRFRVFYDADNSNTLDGGECANDWVQYTVTVNQGSGITTCPANPIVVNNDSGKCSATVPYTVTASGSPAPTMTYAFSGATTGSGSGTGSGSAFNKGTTTVLVTATNACGASFCSFSITVNDNERPTLGNCPANKILKTSDDGGGDCAVTLFYVAPTFSDNCDGTGAANLLSGPASGTSLTVGGPYTITYTKTDLAGNAVLANCVFSVTVQDDTKPAISCPANIIRSNDPGQCSAVVTYATPNATDNCGSASATLQSAANTASGSTFPTGTTTVEWKATDVATPTANTATCSFTITVQETQAPTLACPANQVRSTNVGTCAASATYTATASDNCTTSPALSYSFSGATTVAPWAAGTGSGSNFNKGITTVALRAVDEAGLTRTCTFRIVVSDTEAPTLLNCNSPAPVNAAANACSAVVTYAMPTFTDNCAPTSGTAVRISGPVSGSSISVGSNNVIFQATDASGKTSRCTITLTVADNQAPVVVCPPSSTVSGDGIPCTKQVFYTTPTASDNCDGTLTSFLFSGWSSGSIFPAGVSTNVWRAVAANGQTGECSFTVTVTCAASKPFPPPSTARPSEIAEQLGSGLALTLAPNPSRDYVVFALTGMDTNGDLLAFDALGRLMVQQAIAVGQDQGRLDVSNWPQGTYRIYVKTDQALVTKTLVVQKD